jgi:hypothetical protein
MSRTYSFTTALDKARRLHRAARALRLHDDRPTRRAVARAAIRARREVEASIRDVARVICLVGINP